MAKALTQHGPRPAKVELVDAAGSRVTTIDVSASRTVRIPRGKLPAGVYLVRVLHEGGHHTQKVALLP